MQEAWEVFGWTLALTAAVSLGVAVLIHLMTVLVRGFARPAVEAPPAHDAELAAVIAAAYRCRAGGR